MYIHIIKRAAKRTPAPSLHKDSNLGVPGSPLGFYLRGDGRGHGLGERSGIGPLPMTEDLVPLNIL
jgi:hypothetical protein